MEKRQTLSCPPLFASRERIAAFTLAETLITLGIIGVVAALTLPNLIVKYQKQVTVTKLKKAYTVAQQAVRLAEQENGSINEWFSEDCDWSSTALNPIFEKNLIKYMKSVKVEKGLFGYDRVTLSDGIVYQFAPDGDSGGKLIGLGMDVDVNGPNGPNTIGKDYFSMYLNIRGKKAGLVEFNEYLWGCNGTWRYCIINQTPYGCNGKNNPENHISNCGRLIQYDGWEIKDDYPW